MEKETDTTLVLRAYVLGQGDLISRLRMEKKIETTIYVFNPSDLSLHGNYV